MSKVIPAFSRLPKLSILNVFFHFSPTSRMKKSLLSISSVVGLLFLTGCAAPVVNYQPQTQNISEPPLNSTNEKQIGDELLRQGKYREHDAIRVTTPVKASWAYTIHPGYFLKMGEDKDAEYYRIGGAGEDSGFVEKSAIADPYQSLMVKRDKNTLCIVTVFNGYGCDDSTVSNFERTKKPIISQDTVQRTLIYSGKVGNKINVGYREFSGSMARPAFSNSVEYDLSESKSIGYKGALLEIIEATNRSIKYKVISNFNTAEK